MKFKKRDIFVIAGILLVALSFILAISLTKKPGSSVVIEVNTVRVLVISLEEDGVYTLRLGENNEETHVLCVKDGEAYLLSATCPDHLCVNFGKISYNGESITCLPYKLQITVSSEKKSSVELVS